MSNSPFITEVTQATFAKEVLEKSRQAPVLVDFWAGWCNPCKMLMPILAKLADEYQGNFFLAKVNTDVERALAEQYGIRSLPTVKVFKQGDIVDEFMGVLPESGVKEIIERHVLRASDFVYADAMKLIESGDVAAAQSLLEKTWNEDPGNKKISVALARLYLKQDNALDARNAISKLGVSAAQDPEVEEIEAKLVFAESLIGAPSTEELEQRVAADPENCDAWLQLGARQAVAGNYEQALEAFFQTMRIDKTYKDGAGRKGMLAIFTILGGRGPLVMQYRSKMASVLH